MCVYVLPAGRGSYFLFLFFLFSFTLVTVRQAMGRESTPRLVLLLKKQKKEKLA